MKKQLLVLLFSVLTLNANAQNWGGGIDEQDFNWGFSFQYIASEFKLTKSPNWQDIFLDYEQNNRPITDKLNAISSPVSAGFGIGFVMNYKLTKHFDLRSTPTLVFTDRLVNYQYALPSVNVPSDFTDGKWQQKVSATMVDLPLGIKFKSERRKDFRAYLLLGAKYSMDLASGKKVNDADKALIYKFLKNKKNFASYEAAIGFDLYFEYFKMSPELKVSHSFGDILRHENHPFATPIDKAILRNFTFSLFFE
ncbi:outer membrane beta-barrel protein [Pedobacter sp. SL55]|uniref:type IX secretion/gliding motility protein PorT/SprT n=1 Tax=Pedobacter sp. SL55 TaxID=2995161 RepID=UPI002270F9CF|nr:outer membrane beta-barrel protein [Pedobacter sp. SL55]WAC40761.1 outer membrane beta-barrel protein [Pedobacter sp. SL55]